MGGSSTAPQKLPTYAPPYGRPLHLQTRPSPYSSDPASPILPAFLRYFAAQVIVPTPEVEQEGRSLSEYMRLPVDQYVGIEVRPRSFIIALCIYITTSMDPPPNLTGRDTQETELFSEKYRCVPFLIRVLERTFGITVVAAREAVTDALRLRVLLVASRAPLPLPIHFGCPRLSASLFTIKVKKVVVIIYLTTPVPSSLPSSSP